MKIKIVLSILLLLAAVAVSRGQGTAFSYQGQLSIDGQPANGNYLLEFSLWDASTNGNQLSEEYDVLVGATNGLFTTMVDFGTYPSGAADWMQIAIGTGKADRQSLPLSPRQQILPVPNAVFATTASNVTGTVSSSQLSGAIANSLLPASPSFSGTVAGDSFSGNGAGLTSLNGGQISSGTISNARLQPDVALLDSSQAFTGINNFKNNVGIGTNNPAYGLHVVSATGDSQIAVQSGDPGNRQWTVQSSGNENGGVYLGSFQIIDRTLDVARLVIATNGNVGIGNTFPPDALDVNGAIVATGAMKASSLTTTGTVSAASVTATNSITTGTVTAGNVTVNGSPAAAGLENLRIIRGAVNYDGSMGNGVSFTISHPSVGDYVITYTQSFNGYPSVTVTPVVSGGGDIVTANLVADSASSFEVHVYDISNFESLSDYAFSFIAVGSP